MAKNEKAKELEEKKARVEELLRNEDRQPADDQELERLQREISQASLEEEDKEPEEGEENPQGEPAQPDDANPDVNAELPDDNKTGMTTTDSVKGKDKAEDSAPQAEGENADKSDSEENQSEAFEEGLKEDPKPHVEGNQAKSNKGSGKGKK